MSTRSNIIVKDPATGMFHSVYCHSDGYISYNGRLLQNHYNSLELATDLIGMGDISSLGETLDYTSSYHKWRGTAIEVYVDADLADHCEEEYYYLFIDGKWMVNDHGRGWCELALALAVDDHNDILWLPMDSTGQLLMEDNS